MSKFDDEFRKSIERERLIPKTLVYTVVTKNSDPSMSDINNTLVMGFTTEEDAVYAVEHLNKRMKEISSNQTYEMGYLTIFKQQYYN